MGRKLLLKANDEILGNKGKTQKFSDYPQIKPRMEIEGDEKASKEYKEEIKVKVSELIDRIGGKM